MNDEQAIQDTQAWLHKAVIGLNLCPFAKAVVVKNQVRYVVCHDADPEAGGQRPYRVNARTYATPRSGNDRPLVRQR